MNAATKTSRSHERTCSRIKKHVLICINIFFKDAETHLRGEGEGLDLSNQRKALLQSKRYAEYRLTETRQAFYLDSIVQDSIFLEQL